MDDLKPPSDDVEELRLTGAVVSVEEPALPAEGTAATGRPVFADRRAAAERAAAEAAAEVERRRATRGGTAPRPAREPAPRPAALADLDADPAYDERVAALEAYIENDLADDERDALRRSRRRTVVGWLLFFVLIGGGFFAVYTLIQNMQSETVATTDVAPLFVTSRPPGATIIVNGASSDAVTPAPVRADDLGDNVSVTVRLPGYVEPSPRNTQLEAGRQHEVRFELQPLPHTIEVVTTPPGAQVLVDGEVQGVSPTSLGPLRVDYRRGVDVLLRHDGFIDEFVTVTWEPGAGSTRIVRELRPDPSAALEEDGDD